MCSSASERPLDAEEIQYSQRGFGLVGDVFLSGWNFIGILYELKPGLMANFRRIQFDADDDDT
jgi:hypothetical protein